MMASRFLAFHVRSLSRALPALLLFLLVSCSQETGRIKGVVRLLDSDDHEGIVVALQNTGHQTVTTSGGVFVLGRIEPGEYSLIAQLEGYEAHIRDGVRVEEGQTLDLTGIVLNPTREARRPEAGTGAVTGSATLEDGRPAAGSLVLIGRDPAFQGAVGPDGAYALADIPAGTHPLLVVRRGFLPYETTIVVSPNLTTAVPRIRLEAGEDPSAKTGIDGIVTMDGAQTPAGVMVLIEGTSFVRVTDGSGRFSIRGLDPGIYDLSFQKIGYRETRLTGIVVEEGEVASVNVEMAFATFDRSAPEYMLEPGGIEGTVVAEGAESQTGVAIVLTPGNFSTLTAADGAFGFEGLRPGAYSLTARRPLYSPAEYVGIVVRSGEMTRFPAITLSPLPEDEIPQAPATLSGMVALEGEIDFSGIVVGLAGTNLTTITEIDGTFLFDAVTPGTYSIVATRNGFEPARQSVEVPPDSEVVLPLIELAKTVVPPKIVAVTPADGARDVVVDDFVEVVIQFDQSMDGSSLKNSIRIAPQVEIQSYFGNEGVASFARSHALPYPYNPDVEAHVRSAPPPAGDNRLVLRLLRYGKPPVALSQDYTVTVLATAANVEGIPIEEPYRFQFTTAGAMLTRTWPEEGATGVYLLENDNLLFEFNDHIDLDAFKSAFRIRPQPQSVPYFHRERVPSGDRIKVDVVLDENTNYTVAISDSVRTRTGGRIENAPFRLRFRSGDLDAVTEDFQTYHETEGPVEISPGRRRILESR